MVTGSALGDTLLGVAAGTEILTGPPFSTGASGATVPHLSKKPCFSLHVSQTWGTPNSLVSIRLRGEAVPHGSHKLRHSVVQGKDHGVGARVKCVSHLEPPRSA